MIAFVPVRERLIGFVIQGCIEKFTRMNGRKEDAVNLRCRADMMDQIIDRFGKDAEILNINPNTFDVTASVAVGSTVLS